VAGKVLVHERDDRHPLPQRPDRLGVGRHLRKVCSTFPLTS
jgi:hypothetical protein